MNGALRSAFLVNIITKHITPEEIFGSHRDQSYRNEKAENAETSIDEYRSLELRIDNVAIMVTYQVKVWEE